MLLPRQPSHRQAILALERKHREANVTAALTVECTPLDSQTLLVCPVGLVDIHTNLGLRQALRPVYQQSPASVVVDLSNVTFLDRTGLVTLVALRRWLASRDGTLMLRSVPPPAQRLLAAVGLHRVFQFERPAALT
ncbi:MAG TPA: STAS domain-containing protein [Mycobacteriales bacterium]|nr:STAS domain-containing protein [Mycobacteriales bacterium]